MFQLIINKLGIFIPTFLAITLLSFSLQEAAPGDPVERILGHNSTSAISEEAYHATAIQLKRDKPFFYGTLSTQAFPDTLYRLVRKDRITALSSKIIAFGNWTLIAAYDRQLMALKNASKGENIQKVLERCAINEHPQQEQTLLKEAAQLASASQKFQTEVADLQTTYQTLSQNSTLWKLYIPKLNWYGIDNQYHHWLCAMLRGDFGISHTTKRSVLATLYFPLKVTLWMSLGAIVGAFLVGTGFGIWLARVRKTGVSYFISNFLFILHALPTFLVATCMVLFLTSGFFIEPVNMIGLAADTVETDEFSTFLYKNGLLLLLPTVCIGYRLMVVVARHLQMSLLDEFKKEYVQTARAKGMREPQIVYYQMLKNAAFPLITLFGQTFPLAVAGSVAVEIIFNIHGMGSAAYNALAEHNYPVIYVIVPLSALVAMTGSLIADVLYRYAHPQKGSNLN